MEEKKLIQMLEKTEEKRLHIMAPFFEKHHIKSDERTVTTLLTLLKDDQSKIIIEENLTELTDLIIELKHQEQLNAQLIQYSLQFIQLSIGMMNPTMQNINYSKQQDKNGRPDKSMFDSKA